MKIVSNKFYLLVIMLLVQIACIKSHAQEEPQKTIQVSKISQQRSSTGQTGSDIYEEKLLHNILPVAPTAASLGMYGTYPVALSNGTLPLNIVLYEIKSGDLTVPITLKNHSGGIKVSQEASWVGLGWDLDFGGSIVRTVNGFPDEDESSAVPDEMSVINEMEKHMNDGQDFDKYSLWSKANDRQYSFRPDNFYYSIGKYSGEFFLKNDTLIPTEFIPITGTLSKLRSLVVTPEGNEYVFNASETTGLTSSHIKQPKYVSTYYIKSIVSPNRTDTIRYTYQQSGVYSTTTSYSFEGFSKISRNVLAYGIDSQDGDPLPLYEMKPIAISGDVYIARVETVKPRYIYFRGGRITFNLSDREDLYPESQSNKAKKLDNIVIEKEEKGRYYAIRKIYFIYSYFSGNGDAASRRLCLDAVRETGMAGEDTVSRPIASFEYYGKDKMPNKHSYSTDYWGYYNGKANSGRIPQTDMSSYKPAFGIMGNADRTPNEDCLIYGSLKSITYPTQGRSEFIWEINRLNLEKPLYKNSGNIYQEKAEKQVSVAPPNTVNCQNEESYKPTPFQDSNPCYAGTDFYSYIQQTAKLTYKIKRKNTVNLAHNKYDKCYIYLNEHLISGIQDDKEETVNVTLEAGEHYTLRIMANCGNIEAQCSIVYDAYNPSDTTSNNEKYNFPFTGLRIRKIIQTDMDGKLISSKIYDYKNAEGKSSGIITTTTEFSNIKNVTNVYEERVSGTTYLTKCENSLISSTLQRGPGESDLIYETVTETVVDNIGAPKSFIQYHYSTEKDDYKGWNIPVVSKSHLRGKLLLKQEYDCSQNKPQLARETRCYYSIDPRIQHLRKGFVMNSPYDIANETVLKHFYKFGDMANNIREVFVPSNYILTSVWEHIDSTTIVEYKDGAYPVRNKTEYAYGNAKHLQPTISTTTMGEDKDIIKTVYSADLNNDIGKEMSDKNMLLYPIEEKRYIKHSGNSENFIEGIHNEYIKDDNGNIILSEIYEFLPDQSLRKQYSYKYNKAGRLIEEMGKDSLPTSIYWNKNYTEPAVIARGMKYNIELANTVSAENYSPQTLYKTPLCSKAQITTFTYSPLIGITSLTKPDGYTVFYQYDGLGRLIKVIDAKGHMLNGYRYNYGIRTQK